jgi:hypothetical protein
MAPLVACAGDPPQLPSSCGDTEACADPEVCNAVDASPDGTCCAGSICDPTLGGALSCLVEAFAG